MLRSPSNRWRMAFGHPFASSLQGKASLDDGGFTLKPTPLRVYWQKYQVLNHTRN